MKVVAIIPARYNSKRFPGKVLASLQGKPLIYHVYTQVKKSKLVDGVIVATDDIRVKKAVESFNGKCIMTSTKHRSGTDRIAEAAQSLDMGDADIIVNVQGDEPLINPDTIDDAIQPLLVDKHLKMLTVKVALTGLNKMGDRNIVKVITDKEDNATAFLRSGVREGCFKHIGLYVYRKSFLMNFASWSQTKIEKSERLEQMRALENGVKIRVVESRYDSIGVDTPEDLKKVNDLLKSRRVLVLVTEYNKVDFFLAIARELENRNYTVLFVCGWLSTYLEMKKKYSRTFFIDYLTLGNDLDREDIETNLITYLQFYSSVSKKPMKHIVSDYACKLYHMVKKFRPAKVLVWNGSQLLEAIGKYFATKEDIPVLHFEKGYFKDTLIADFNGVNSFNSFNGKMEKSIDKERYAQFVAKENSVSSNLFHHPYHPYFLVESLYYLYLYLHPMKNGIKDPITSLKKYITFLDYKFENRKVSQKLPSDFVFLPLQLESDSQVTLHSPHFKDMFSLVQFVYARIPKNLWLVVKTHPAETNFSSYKNIRAFARNKRVLLVEDRPINELIDKSKVVVTINSTVGIESLLFSKPVLVLGNAFYRGKGITFDVDVPEEFSFQLKAALQGSVDHKKIEDFLYQLRFHYLHEGDYRNPSRFNFKSIINMIETK